MEELARELADATARKKQAEQDIEDVKGRITALVAQFKLPLEESKSEYLNTEVGYIRVTRPDPPVPRIVTTLLRRVIGNDELFLYVVNLPEFIDVDTQRWDELAEQERVYDSMILKSLEPERPAPKPRVALELGKRKENIDG